MAWVTRPRTRRPGHTRSCSRRGPLCGREPKPLRSPQHRQLGAQSSSRQSGRKLRCTQPPGGPNQCPVRAQCATPPVKILSAPELLHGARYRSRSLNNWPSVGKSCWAPVGRTRWPPTTQAAQPRSSGFRGTTRTCSRTRQGCPASTARLDGVFPYGLRSNLGAERVVACRAR